MSVPLSLCPAVPPGVGTAPRAQRVTLSPLTVPSPRPSQGDSCLSCDTRVLAALLREPPKGHEGEPAPLLVSARG